MSGIETIVKYACLSDKHRWNVNDYIFPWVANLDKHDCEIIKKLNYLADGEHSGLASAVQFSDLMLKEISNGYQMELANDWAEIFLYINIISYEEFRHGLTLGTLVNDIENPSSSYILNQSVNDYGRKYLWCYKERAYWGIYSYLLTHLFSEITNTELYRDMAEQVHNQELKQLILNIMTDEARHARAWLEITKNLANSNPYHKEKMLDSINLSMTHHNAMVHESYFEGVTKMMSLFMVGNTDKKSGISKIIERKYRFLEELFGDDNPFTIDSLNKIHSDFLFHTIGKKKAKYGKDSRYNIEFSRDGID